MMGKRKWEVKRDVPSLQLIISEAYADLTDVEIRIMKLQDGKLNRVPYNPNIRRTMEDAISRYNTVETWRIIDKSKLNETYTAFSCKYNNNDNVSNKQIKFLIYFIYSCSYEELNYINKLMSGLKLSVTHTYEKDNDSLSPMTLDIIDEIVKIIRMLLLYLWTIDKINFPRAVFNLLTSLGLSGAYRGLIYPSSVIDDIINQTVVEYITYDISQRIINECGGITNHVLNLLNTTRNISLDDILFRSIILQITNCVNPRIFYRDIRNTIHSYVDHTLYILPVDIANIVVSYTLVDDTNLNSVYFSDLFDHIYKGDRVI